jgi:hypothetical protein
MSEDERPKAEQEEQQDEVELHGRGHLKAANDEGGSELEDDDVEAHGHHLRNRPGRA